MKSEDNIKFGSISGHALIRTVGIVCMLVGAILLFPLITLFPFPEEISEARYFIIPGVSCMGIGYCLALNIGGKKKERQNGYKGFFVLLTWIFMILGSSIPFILTGKYSFTQAVFECTSGYTTTGLSVVDVTETSHMFLFFRSEMLFVGAAGLILIVASVMSDKKGMKLYESQEHSNKSPAHILQTAKVVVLIYTGYIAAGMILYKIFGMNWFDALNHSIAAVSTGGFSTRPESIGYYNNLGIEVVTIVLMLAGSVNFFLHLSLLRGKWKNIYTDCEIRFSLFIYPFATVVITALLAEGFSMSIPEGIRIGIFQSVSAMTTTGLRTLDSFQDWNSALLFVMILLMIIGGSAASMSGGIKQYRVWIQIKEVYWNIKASMHNKRVVFARKITRCGREIEVDHRFYRESHSFITAYLFLLMAGTFVFTCYGYSLEDSLFEMASSLSTVGFSTGIIGYDAPSAILWVSTLGMFLGRLEIFVVFITIGKLIGHINRRVRKGVRKWKR